MEFCRICLSGAPDKHISQLKTNEKDKIYSEVFAFCLDIKIEDNCEKFNKLCVKCFNNILTYYDFKSMALKNDAYLKMRNQEKQLTIKVESMQEPAEVIEIVVLSDVKYEMLQVEYEDLECIPNNAKAVDVQIELEEVAKAGSFNTKDTPNNSPIFSKTIHKLQINKANSIRSNKNIDQTKRLKNQVTLLKKDVRAPGICDQCGIYASDMNKHYQVHLPKERRRTFQCTECDKAYFSKGSLNEHKNRKHLGKLKHCDLCNKDFIALKYHIMRVHKPETLPLECRVCKARAPNKSTLSNHMKIHTKERPYQCDYCGKNYRLKEILNYHIRSVHLKEKNFFCEHCPRSFFMKNHWKRHFRRAHKNE